MEMGLWNIYMYVFQEKSVFRLFVSAWYDNFDNMTKRRSMQE